MGWMVFWAVVIVGLGLMWFSPYLRRCNRPPKFVGKPGSTEGGPSDASVRSGELGRGGGYWTNAQGGW